MHKGNRNLLRISSRVLPGISLLFLNTVWQLVPVPMPEAFYQLPLVLLLSLFVVFGASAFVLGQIAAGTPAWRIAVEGFLILIALGILGAGLGLHGLFVFRR